MADYTAYELGNILRKLEKKVDAALCCCESLELKNLGLGVPIYVGRFKNYLKIRSLVAGTNMNITYDNNTITFDSLAGGFTCSDLNSCSTSNLPEGSNLYYTNARVLSYMTGQNISIFTNDSGYITSLALTPYLTISTAASTYETIIAPGTVTDYWRGDKTWQPFPTIPSVTPSALTKTDDTNVTLTLGGTPATALLQPTSLTLGWTGTLADGRIASATTWNNKQNALSGTGVVKSTAGAISYINGTSGQYIAGDGSLISFPSIPTVGTWGALNYPAWTTGIPFVKMTAAGTFALDTNTYLTSAVTSINSLTGAAQTIVAGTSGTDFVVNSVGTTHTLNLPTASATNRGALSTADWTTFNGKILSVLNSMTVGTIAASTTTYILPESNIASATESARTYYLNNACTAARYLVATSTAQSATGSLVVTFRNSAASTSITVTIAAGSAAGRVTDYVNTASCLVDSGISHQVVNNATATSANIAQISINLK